jgi:hypothetical protein
MTPVEERKPKKDWRNIPVFADITRDACAFLEAACNTGGFQATDFPHLIDMMPRPRAPLPRHITRPRRSSTLTVRMKTEPVHDLVVAEGRHIALKAQTL